MVELAATDIPPRTPEDLARLKAAMRIPEQPGEAQEYDRLGPPVRRDESGQIVRPALSPIRRAILKALGRRNLTRYHLWKKAHARCETLSASAVYEYLRGTRNIGSEYVEALLEAAGLKVVESNSARAKKARKPADKVAAR